MSLHISTLNPLGDLLIASDTRMCKNTPDGSVVVVRDDVSKTIQLDEHTFVFMSGNYGVVQYAANIYRAQHVDVVQNNRKIITRILRTVYDMVPPEYKVDGEEIAVVHVMRRIGGKFSGELYMHARNYEPIINWYVPGGIVVLGSYIPGTDDQIRSEIKAAQTCKDTISAFQKVYKGQCRPEVGGTLELFIVPQTLGTAKKLCFSIKEAENV